MDEIKNEPGTGDVEIVAAQRKLTRIRSGMMGALCLALGVIPDANDPRMEHFSDDENEDKKDALFAERCRREQEGDETETLNQFERRLGIPGYRIERRATDLLSLPPPVAVMPSRQRLTIDERKRKTARKVSRAARKKNRK